MNKAYKQLTNLHNALAAGLNQAEREMLENTNNASVYTSSTEITDHLHVVYSELSNLFRLNLDKVATPDEHAELVASICLDNGLENSQNMYPDNSQVKTILEDKFIKAGSFLKSLREAIQKQDAEEAFVQYANLSSLI